MIRPNADTLYSNSFTDLSSVGLEITVLISATVMKCGPFTICKFWRYDVASTRANGGKCGNNVANIGSIASATGKFLFRHDTDSIDISTASAANSSYNAVVGKPTPYGPNYHSNCY